MLSAHTHRDETFLQPPVRMTGGFWVASTASNCSSQHPISGDLSGVDSRPLTECFLPTRGVRKHSDEVALYGDQPSGWSS